MKKPKVSVLLSTLIIMLLTLFSCTQDAKVDVKADTIAINELYDTYILKVNAGDLEGFLSLWTDDAIRMEPGMPTIAGKENIREFFAPQLEQFNIEATRYGNFEVQVFGDLSFTRGNYTLLVTSKEGGPTTHLDGKWLGIEERQVDGSWKIYIDMINFNKPATVENELPPRL